MGIIAGAVRAALFSAVIGTIGYNVGHSRGYTSGHSDGRALQRERDAIVMEHERQESAMRLETIATESYVRLRGQIQEEGKKPIDLSDERYERLREAYTQKAGR